MMRYMKKILSAITAAAVFLLFPMISCTAEDTVIDQDSASNIGIINVEYNAETEYTVVIPAGVTFTDTEKVQERGIEARNVMLPEGNSLHVTVSSLNNFRIINGDSYIVYSLEVNHNPTPETESNNVLTVAAGEKSGWAILIFSTDLDKENALYAGKYSDILTFTVAIS